MSSPLVLDPTLAAKIASVVVHADEMLSADGHPFDKTALEQALQDPDVVRWISDLGPLAPRKRRP